MKYMATVIPVCRHLHLPVPQVAVSASHFYIQHYVQHPMLHPLSRVVLDLQGQACPVRFKGISPSIILYWYKYTYSTLTIERERERCVCVCVCVCCLLTSELVHCEYVAVKVE